MSAFQVWDCTDMESLNVLLNININIDVIVKRKYFRTEVSRTEAWVRAHPRSYTLRHA
jgi:hypothetical protein